MFKQISRRELLKLSSLAFGGTVVACLSSSLMAATSSGSQLISRISNNHGHIFAIDLESLFANGPRNYSIRGSASHDHTLVITNQILAALRRSRVVDVESTVDFSHSHMVRLMIV